MDTCDVVLDFDDTQTGFAACFVSGVFPSAADHIAISQGNIYLDTGTQAANEFDWFYNPILLNLPTVLPATAAGGARILAGLVAASGGVWLLSRHR